MNRRMISSIAVAIVIVTSATADSALAGRWRIYQLTDNAIDDVSPRTGIGEVVWLAQTSKTSYIRYSRFAGPPVTLSTGSAAKAAPDISDSGVVVWQERVGYNDTWEIFTYRDDQPVRLTDNKYDDIDPIAGPTLFWRARVNNGDWELISRSGDVTTALTNDTRDDIEIHAYADKAAWIKVDPDGGDDLYFYDGDVVRRLVGTDAVDGYTDISYYNPVIGSNAILCERSHTYGGEPGHAQIYYQYIVGLWRLSYSVSLYNNDIYADYAVQEMLPAFTTETDREINVRDFSTNNSCRITDNAVDDLHPRVYMHQVTWEGGNPITGSREIYVYEISETSCDDPAAHIQPLSALDTLDDRYPDISRGHIVWQSWDGNDWEIMLAVLCSDPLPADLNGDCEVNLKDLALMCQDWLGCTMPSGYCH